MQLTDEQKAVIAHPLGQHARVLAVAGSGKTTTMTYRVKHLIEQHNVPAYQIGLLMFNRLAREQFEMRLRQVGVQNAPRVYTFHSFAYQLIHDAARRGVCDPIKEKWFSENREEARRLVLRIIQRMEYNKEIKPDSIDPEEALLAISLWKSALIPPERAGYRGKAKFPEVYLAFEEQRIAKGALTFDDFLPMAVQLLERESAVGARWLKRFQYLIVDEYQDVNYSQQRLIELLAGTHADVMVVGDDDQTIYEWRGARPSYIIHEFKKRFDNKPITNYTLSHSFRFGPIVAQCAQNAIEGTRDRVPKPVIAHNTDKTTDITVLHGEPQNTWAVNEQLADIIQAYINDGHDLRELIVLGRMYSQMNGLELAFLTRQQPYRVEGSAPLMERREIVALLDYVRMANALNDIATPQTRDWLLSTANVPNRMLRRSHLYDAITAAIRAGKTVRVAMRTLSEPETTPFGQYALSWFDDYYQTIDMLSTALDEKAGDILSWLVNFVGYMNHFDDYYGLSEAAEDRKRAVMSLLHYAETTDLSLLDFLAHVEGLDTTHGAPPEQQVVLTSIYRVKGLEYNVVVIPDCFEGYIPCLVESENLIFDKAGIVDEPDVSQGFDDERRLFYVALTRAKQHVYIGSVRFLHGDEEKQNLPLISTFVVEMFLDDTRAAFDAYQARDIPRLTDVLQEAFYLHTLTDNMIATYLPQIGAHDTAKAMAIWREEQDRILEQERQEAEARQQAEAEAFAEAVAQDIEMEMVNESPMERARKHHPRAYAKWTPDEEKRMMSLLEQGMSVEAVAAELQRQPGAIRSRQQKIEERENGASAT